MIKLRLVALIAFTLNTLSACVEPTLTLPTNVPVTVIELDNKTSERTIPTDSESYRKLVAWISNNQSGWSSYLAPPPGKGIIVRAGELDLQFIGTTVLVHTSKGVFTKSISFDDYSFLLHEKASSK
jgi:hypothetical protein